MKSRALHRFGFGDTNRWGEGAIERAEQVLGRNGSAESEASDLGQGVDAGVGAARALGQWRFSRDAAERSLQLALDGREAGLHLPALKVGAVVGEGKLPGLEAGIGLRLIGHWIRCLSA